MKYLVNFTHLKYNKLRLFVCKSIKTLGNLFLDFNTSVYINSNDETNGIGLITK